MTEPDRSLAQRLAQESLARGDATGWFDALYDAAKRDPAHVPWADLRVNPNLASWLAERQPAAGGKRALVVGCGLGDDAEELARLGFAVTAFDISPRCVEWCRERFADTTVDFRVADLLRSPTEWREAFDLVVEIYTLQALPNELRAAARANLADFIAPGGTLLVIARGREPHEGPGAMPPWPLTVSEFDGPLWPGLERRALEDYRDDERPPVRRLRVEFCRLA